MTILSLLFLLTFGLRNNQESSRGALFPNHKCHGTRLLWRCHGEYQSVLAALARHLVHLVLLQRAGAEPPDTLANICVAQLTHKFGVLTCRHCYVLQLCNNPYTLCGGRRGYIQLAFKRWRWNVMYFTTNSVRTTCWFWSWRIS